MSLTSDLRTRLYRDYVAAGNLAIGARLPATRELAATYRTSHSSVAKAIEVLVAEGWLSKRWGSGVYLARTAQGPATALPRGGGQRLGFVVSNLRQPLAARVLEGVCRVGRRAQVSVEVATTGGYVQEERRQVEALIRSGVHGVLVMASARSLQDEEYLHQPLGDAPILILDIYDERMQRPHLIFDNEAAGYDMARYLLNKGHGRVGFVGFEGHYAYRSVDDRRRGYQRALAEAGVREDSVLVARLLDWRQATADPDAALERALDRLLAAKPTALILPNDQTVGRALMLLQRRGVAVPDDLVLAGFDNIQDEVWGCFWPTTNPDFIRMGELGAEMVLARLQSRDTTLTERVLSCPLLVPDPQVMHGIGAIDPTVRAWGLTALQAAQNHSDPIRAAKAGAGRSTARPTPRRRTACTRNQLRRKTA